MLVDCILRSDWSIDLNNDNLVVLSKGCDKTLQPSSTIFFWDIGFGVIMEKSSLCRIDAILDRLLIDSVELFIVKVAINRLAVSSPCVFQQTHSITFLMNLWGFGVPCRVWSESKACNLRWVLSNAIYFLSSVKLSRKSSLSWQFENINWQVTIL